MKKIKAYLIFWLTGWRSIEVFGNPNKSGNYIVYLKNGYLTSCNFSVCTYRWFIPGLLEITNENPGIYWYNMPKKTSFFVPKLN